MVEIKRFGKFLPHDTKLIVYHGSRKLFTRFSNEFNRSGNGKNVYGWGIYVSETIEHASMFAMNHHWCYLYNDIIIDGKLYDVKSLHKSMDETISDYNFKGGTDHIYLELAKGIKFSDILNSTVNKELILKAYNIIAEYVDKNNAPGRFLVKEIINKLKICKSISFKQKDIGYVYECELTVGKLFTRALTPTDIHFIKGQMKRERINVDLFKEDPNAGYSYSSHFYDNLVRYYHKKRNNNSNYVDPVAERKASLFLHRCGYEAIQCGGGEYVVIDINCLKITNTIKV